MGSLDCEVNGIVKDSEGQEWEVVEATLDSGACETVAPESEGSKAWLEYSSASGHAIENQCQRKFQGVADDFVSADLTAQVCKVNKFLAAASRICEAGNRVVLGDEGSFVENKVTGKRTMVDKVDGTYRFTLWSKKSKGPSTGYFHALGEVEEQVFARLAEELL